VSAKISAVAKTLVFTVFVPGTVAGYVPWRLRRAAVTGVDAWAAFIVITIGVAIYLHTAFWGFALIGGGTPAPIAPTAASSVAAVRIVASLRMAAASHRRWRIAADVLNFLNRRNDDITYAYVSRITPTGPAEFTSVFHPAEPVQARVSLVRTFGGSR